MRSLILPALALWVGTTLLLSRLRWMARAPLTERLRPYVATASVDAPGRGLLSVESFREVAAPLARSVGERLSRALGTSEDLAVRLRRVHSPLDPTAFRLRQMAWSGAALGAAVLFTQAAGLAPGPALLIVVGSPLLAFLLVEQRLAKASATWQRRVFLELPVVTEQLGMLLSAGYSLGSAINRLADRGRGACGRDLQRVSRRMQQGVTEVAALQEWATVVAVDDVERLVTVLALNREAGDLGRLIGEEARANRSEVQRRTIETIERHGQQVWIPVTVATLVPGVLFMAVPFIEAMRLFTAG